jgi:hypothetical protein
LTFLPRHVETRAFKAVSQERQRQTDVWNWHFLPSVSNHVEKRRCAQIDNAAADWAGLTFFFFGRRIH